MIVLCPKRVSYPYARISFHLCLYFHIFMFLFTISISSLSVLYIYIFISLYACMVFCVFCFNIISSFPFRSHIQSSQLAFTVANWIIAKAVSIEILILFVKQSIECFTLWTLVHDVGVCVSCCWCLFIWAAFMNYFLFQMCIWPWLREHKANLI